MFVEILSSSTQHLIKFKSKLKFSFFSKLNFVKPLPVPLTSILLSNVEACSNLLIIFNPSLILLVPPVKITIFELFLLIYLTVDKIFSLYSINPMEKYVKIEVIKIIKLVLKIDDNIYKIIVIYF